MEECIGAGNFGEVFRGTWCGTEVAVKHPHRNIPADIMDKFLAEVSLMTTLHHPNIGILLKIFSKFIIFFF